MAVARALYQGADVWLNTPRRPLEACGTSGMKAALNGALNCSILDGWWAEWFIGRQRLGGHVGRVGRGPRASRRAGGGEPLRPAREPDRAAVLRARPCRHPPGLGRPGAQRLADARAAGDRCPHGARLHDASSTSRSRSGPSELWRDTDRRARELVAWKDRVRDGWGGVHIDRVDGGAAGHRPGRGAGGVGAGVAGLARGGRRVGAARARPGRRGRRPARRRGPSRWSSTTRSTTSTARYVGRFSPTRAGRYGYTVRVLPAHADLVTPVELGLIAWS